MSIFGDPVLTGVSKASASGPIASFSDGAKGLPLRSLLVNIEPVQAGSGDPSPDNVRPISGWSAVNVWVKPTYDPTANPTATIQLGQTVYGGTLNVTNGVLTVEWANIASYNGETLPERWISDRDVYVPGTTPTIGAQVVYTLATPITIPLTATQISTLQGQNNVWADSGDVMVEYIAQSLMAIGFINRR